MRVAVISDIHANLPALRASLEEIDRTEPEEIWCLGDVVGYGAQPDECAALVRERCQICLVGNHDLAVLGELDISSFSAAAADAVRWTRENSSADTREFLAGLEPEGDREGVALFHASPRDPVWEYVLTLEQAADCLELQPQRVTLIGHSHVSLYFTGGAESRPPVRGAQAPDETSLDLAEGRWLVNPGSIGQPRDSDPRASWLEFDTEESTVRFHRVEYDIDLAAEPIVAAGLPKHLAERLYLGQ